MKLVLFRISNRTGSGKQMKTDVERVIMILAAAAFITLLIVQAALLNPSINTLLHRTDNYDGLPLGTDEYLYREGSISLRLLNAETAPDLKVLVNGDEVAAFTERSIALKVREGDLIEIDGSGTESGVQVEVVSGSDNVDLQCIGKKVRIKSDVKSLIKVRMDF